MEIIQHLGTLLGLSFISGINLYATVAVVGLAIQNGLVSGLPPDLHWLANDAVIAVAVVLYLVEFFMDKIPGLDTAWDALHTFIRPLGGALLALMQVGESSPPLQVIVFLLGASLASTAHFTKAGFRLLVNTSPEPFSNFAVSVGEDVGAIGLCYLSLVHPLATLVLVLALLALIVVTLPILLRTLRMLVTAVLSRLFGWLSGAAERPAAPGLSPGQDAFFAQHRRPDEHSIWTGPAYAGRIPGLPRAARITLVITDVSLYALHRRLTGNRLVHLRLDEIQEARLVPGRLLPKLVIFGQHGTWSVPVLARVAPSLPLAALQPKR